MMYQREKILLALLEQLGEAVTSIKLQKLIFLLCDRMERRPYDFVPYRYGCYSFQLSQDLKHLAAANLIKISECGYEKNCFLTTYSRKYCSLVNSETLSHITKIVSRFGTTQSSELIKFTYIQYPFFAINSQILENFFDEAGIKTIRNTRPRKNERTLFTIGYEGLSLEKYIITLILKDIRVLCDVRKNAYSQKFGFSKSLLSKACEGVGIKYIHMPELGIYSEKRRNLKNQDDFNRLFEEYESTVLLTEKVALNHLFSLLQAENRIALTCFEHDPLQCHRLRIANKLMSIKQCNYNLVNL